MADVPTRVMFLPGAVMPADLAYVDLLAELGDGVDAAVKDLELYREDAPPPGYSLDDEVAGALALAADRGWARFHLVGYSAGGSASLAFAARHPARLLSLALLEPAWAGSWGWSEEHRQLWAQYDALTQLPPEESLPAFMRLQVRPDVALPPRPDGPPPPWMSRRPAGIRALINGLHDYDLDRHALAGLRAPVYFALGGLSNPRQFAEEADRLAQVFADFTLEVYADRHHFDPPHRIEPARLASSLRDVWARGEQALTGPGGPPTID